MSKPTPREVALAIWRGAIAAGDPERLVDETLSIDGGRLSAGTLTLELSRLRRVLVLGCGKASAAMARATERVLGDRITDGLVVVKDGYTRSTHRIRVTEAGHPVPDRRGQAAAAALLEMARGAGADALVVVLLSGGGSALAPAPAPPVTLEEKQQVTRLLLAAGATIGELNAVRKHLSLFKGGHLARAAWPATVLTLALSDVIGDSLDVIASGPTAPDSTTFGDALAVVDAKGARASVPAAVLARLEAGERGEVEETPKPGAAIFERVTNLVIGNNALVTDASLALASRLGYRPHFLTRALDGEARHVARDLVARGRALGPPACLVAAGETTVTVRGRGQGGRCQEFALAAALEIAGEEGITVLAAGTDGTDGPTDAAGAIVDGATVLKGARLGLDARRALDDNDAHTFLRATGDLVVSGPTNTNLLDLYLVLRA